MPLTDVQILKKVGELRRTKGKIYAPLKYFRGLTTLKDVETRYKKMLKPAQAVAYNLVFDVLPVGINWI